MKYIVTIIVTVIVTVFCVTAVYDLTIIKDYEITINEYKDVIDDYEKICDNYSNYMSEHNECYVTIK